MGITATLNGNTITEGKLEIPAWGASYHEVTLDKAVTLSGKCTLVVADLTVQCSVIAGGPTNEAGRSYYRLVSGAGGWPTTIPAKSWANDAGVKFSTVLQDAANAVGETVDASTIPSGTTGVFYTRAKDQACRVLEECFPAAWYVGEDGVTRIGKRTPPAFTSKAARTSELDLARGTLTIMSDTIAGILPGVTIDGLTVVDVEHTFSAGAGLRTKVYGAQGANGTSRRLAAWRKLFETLNPRSKFEGYFEYRIVAQNGNRVDLQPVRTSTGMPSLQRVFVRPGMPGASAKYALGARVVVGFVNNDPGSPVVIRFADADDGAFLPESLTIDATDTVTLGGDGTTLGGSGSVQIGGPGGNPMARMGDQVTTFLPPMVIQGVITGVGPFVSDPTAPMTMTGMITSGSDRVTCK